MVGWGWFASHSCTPKSLLVSGESFLWSVTLPLDDPSKNFFSLFLASSKPHIHQSSALALLVPESAEGQLSPQLSPWHEPLPPSILSPHPFLLLTHPWQGHEAGLALLRAVADDRGGAVPPPAASPCTGAAASRPQQPPQAQCWRCWITIKSAGGQSTITSPGWELLPSKRAN